MFPDHISLFNVINHIANTYQSKEEVQILEEYRKRKCVKVMASMVKRKKGG